MGLQAGRILREVLTYGLAEDGQALALVELVQRDRQRPRENRRPQQPTFLLVHGFSQNRRAFIEGPIPSTLLARGARVFVGELRGHGRSRVGQDFTWDLRTHLDLDCPALIGATLARSGAKAIHFIGHSMGGVLGYALLGHAPLASLTTLAAPLSFWPAPLARLAEHVVPFFVRSLSPGPVPIDKVLAVLAGPMSQARSGRAVLQELVGLANPHLSPERPIRSTLGLADPEAPAVLLDMARALLSRGRDVGGRDARWAIQMAPIPIATVVGAADTVAPRPTVALIETGDHRGPRRVLEVDDAGHLDLVLSGEASRVVEVLWDFLVGS